MSTIEVSSVGVNNVGGIWNDTYTYYYYTGEKEIKYLTFYYLPYNSVNDIVSCTITGKAEVGIKVTGPIIPGKTGSVSGESVWNNSSITKIVITKIHIQYMDNTEEVIDGKDVKDMYEEGSVYYREFVHPSREAKKITEKNTKSDIIKACSTVLVDLKNDECSLLRILTFVALYRCTSWRDVKKIFTIGDYVEEKFGSDEEIMKRDVKIWKVGIETLNDFIKYTNVIIAKIIFSISRKKYIEKIKKYEPEYVVPKK